MSLKSETLSEDTPAGRVIAAVAILLAVALALYGQLAQNQAVWSLGSFDDTDDAMRMVQVRDFLAGQGWFDLTAHRLDPPHGLFMHWSRIVDVPLAAGVKFFSLFLPAVEAERAARIAFPALCLGLLFAAGAFAGRVFAGARYGHFGVLTAFCCGEMFLQFRPGRIDHHAPQIVLLLAAVAAMAKAMDPKHARAGMLAGALVAVSLGIGLENLVFLVMIAAVPGAVFLVRGEEAAPLLRSFAIGVAGMLLPIYLATIPPSRWLVPACDALSVTQFLAAAAGAAAYAGLGWAAPWIKSAGGWLLALGLAALAAIAPFLIVSPGCILDPFDGLDPLLRDVWLSHVPEMQSLRGYYAISPLGAVLLATPAIGFLGCLFGVLQSRGVARARWLFLCAVAGAGIAAGAMHIRVLTSIMPLAAVGVLAPVSYIRERIAVRYAVLAVAASFFLVIGSSYLGLGFTAVSAGLIEPGPSNEASNCTATNSYASLAGLPPGRTVAEIWFGPYILVGTPLTVFAAPYHRNNHGNRLALDVLAAEPAEAEALARAAEARYIVLCPDRAVRLARRWPRGLAARLLGKEEFPWLKRITLAGTPLEVFEVTPPADAKAVNPPQP